MTRTIKYIGFYDLQNSSVKRNISLAATNKMDYITDTLNKIGYKVHIISPAYSVENNIKFNKKENIKVSENKRITLFPSIGNKSKFSVYINLILTQIYLFIYLIRNVRKHETILVYHSIWLSFAIKLAKLVKGFNYILELEEIYSDISHKKKYFLKYEYQLINDAKSYIIATDALKKRISKNKKYIVLYGNYKVEKLLTFPLRNNKKYLLYAGIIDKEKAGAFNAIEAAALLPSSFIMNIIGFGDVNNLQDRIKEINLKNSCTISFDGVKTGIDYVRYCQQNHIGLSTQKMQGSYTETSFPSKILSYLSFGINVISSDIPSVRESPMGDLINYYTEDNPHSIAEAIKKSTIHPSSVLQKRIMELDIKFISDLKTILYDA
jgi:hypothetical protein